MERFARYVEEANKAFKIADHLIYVTYPVLRDNKLLVTALEHLHAALQDGMAALLYYDALYKRISAFPQEAETKLYLFRRSTARRYGLGDELCMMIRDVAELAVSHRKSPVEFSRRDAYVIASETYKLKTLTQEKMKRYIGEAKAFLTRVNEIYAIHERRTH